MMAKIFPPMLYLIVLVYLDDVLVFSNSVQEHATHLRAVLQRLLDKGLRAKRSKCEFFKPEIHFLGHTVNAQGIHTQHSKISAIEAYPEPKNKAE